MKKKRGNNNSSDLVTKKYLDNRFDRFEIRTDLKLDTFERKVLDQVRLIRDDIQTSNDKVVKELDDIRTNYQTF